MSYWHCSHIMLLYFSLPLVAVAYLDGTLAVYDLSTQTLRHRCQHEVSRKNYSDRYQYLNSQHLIA